MSMRSGQPGINGNEYGTITFSLPPTLAEQTGIAQILSDMDAEIAALESKLAKARQIQGGHDAGIADREDTAGMKLDALLEALDLGEDQDTEFKAAEGGLPRSVWEAVSAFANTEGGTLVLGVAERDGEFAIEGVRKPETVIKAFWDDHNNPQKLNSLVQ